MLLSLCGGNKEGKSNCKGGGSGGGENSSGLFKSRPPCSSKLPVRKEPKGMSNFTVSEVNTVRKHVCYCNGVSIESTCTTNLDQSCCLRVVATVKGNQTVLAVEVEEGKNVA